MSPPPLKQQKRRELWVYPVCGTGTLSVDHLAVFEWGSSSVHCFETSHICCVGLGSRLKPWANLPTISFGPTSLPGKGAVAAVLCISLLLKSIWNPECSTVTQSTNYDNRIGRYREGSQTLFTFTCINRHRIKLHINLWLDKIPDLRDWAVWKAHYHTHTHTQTHTHSSRVHQHSEGAKVHSWIHHYNCIN